MAKQQPATTKPAPTKPAGKGPTTAVAPVNKGAIAESNKKTAVALSMDDMAADAGSGMEGATAESFAIPFLSVLQKGSPQVDETASPGGEALVEGAKAGMFYENISGKLTDGKEGAQFVACAYKRVFIRWGARDAGGGFKGEYTPEAILKMRDDGDIVELDGKLYAPAENGSVNPKTCDQFKDTRNHYILILDEEGGWTEALLSLTSTQIKKSKMLMSALAAVKVNGPNGMFTPPTFSSVINATSIAESNDKGSWYGVKFERVGAVDRREVYEAAKRFHGSVKAGAVQAKYEQEHDADGGDGKI